MTARTRAEVDLIKAFFGFRSTQAVIDAAVGEFLRNRRQTHDGYRIAAEALDRQAEATTGGRKGRRPHRNVNGK